MIRKPLLLYSFIFALLAMFAVAAAGINADSIWHDEYLSLFYAGAMSDVPTTPLDTVARIIERDAGQAPLYYVLLSLWGNLAGWSEFSARILSLFFGALAVSWIYRAGADLHSTHAGFFAAILLAASAFFNVYLHEIRMYSLVILLVAILIWLYPRALEAKRSPKWNALFVLATVATLYTHPFMTVVIAALGMYHLVLAPRTQSWFGTLMLLMVSGLLFSPWAWFIVSKISSKPVTSDFDFLRTNGEILIDLAKAASNGYWIFLLIPLLSLRFLRADRGILMLWWLGVISISALLIVNHRSQAINQLRYFLYLLPMFALLGGFAFAQVMRNWKIAVAILVAWCVSGLVVAPTFGNLLYIPSEFVMLHITFPIKQLTEAIRREASENDAIVFDFPHHSWALQGVVDYYMKGTSTRYILTETLGNDDDGQARIALYRHFLGDSGRVFYVSDHTIGADEFSSEYRRILSERYGQCDSLWDSEQAKLDKYARIDALCHQAQQSLVQYESSVALTDFVYQQTDKSHDFYSIWSAPLPADAYSFSLRFWDAQGKLLQQMDNPLPVGEFNYRIDRVPRSQLPEGETVRIDAVIYDWRTGARLLATDGSDIVFLATINT